MPTFRSRVAIMLALLGVPGCPVSAEAAPPVSAPGTSTLERELVMLIRHAAAADADDCSAIRSLLGAVRAASGAERASILRDVSARIAERGATGSGPKACVVLAAAQLVKELPEDQRATAADDVARWALTSDAWGWRFVDETFGEVVRYLSAQQIDRIVRRASGSCCLSARIAAHLAIAGRESARDALRKLLACKDCMTSERLAAIEVLLPKLDQRQRGQLLRDELRLLDEAASSWGLDHVYAVARYARHIEPSRRPALVLAALRRLRELEIEPQPMNVWDDIPPPGHFVMVLGGIAPALGEVTLVTAGLSAIPADWPHDQQDVVLAFFIRGLPKRVRAQSLPRLMERVAGPAESLPAIRARLAAADVLPERELQVLVARALELESDARARAELLGGVLRIMPLPAQGDYDQRIVRDLLLIETNEARARAAVRVLDLLSE